MLKVGNGIAMCRAAQTLLIETALDAVKNHRQCDVQRNSYTLPRAKYIGDMEAPAAQVRENTTSMHSNTHCIYVFLCVR